MRNIEYDYVRQKNEDVLEMYLTNRILQEARQMQPSIGERLRIRLSDELVSIAEWIRPPDRKAICTKKMLNPCEPA